MSNHMLTSNYAGASINRLRVMEEYHNRRKRKSDETSASNDIDAVDPETLMDTACDAINPNDSYEAAGVIAPVATTNVETIAVTLGAVDGAISSSALSVVATTSTDTPTPITHNKYKRRKKNDTKHDESMATNVLNMGEIAVDSELANKYILFRPTDRLSDLAGIDHALKQIKEMVFYPVKYPKIYQRLGVRPPNGLLLHGPSGCGKSSLAYSIAGELGLPFFKASGPQLIGQASGDSERNIRELFDIAMKHAPSVLFIDQIDVIAGKTEASTRGMDRRVVAQLSDCIDLVSNFDANTVSATTPPTDSTTSAAVDSNSSSTDTPAASASTPPDDPMKLVILIAATGKVDALEASTRGRFAREILLPVPDAAARSQILRIMSKGITLNADVDIDAISKCTPGYVGADLKALVREAGMMAVSRIVLSNETILCDTSATATTATSSVPDEIECTLEMDDFMRASKTIQPTAKREGFAVVPDVSWEDVGALAEVRDELLHNILEPIANPDKFRSLGLDIPAGVLFFGPPGCGKTLLAKAIANQSGANFISVKGPELLNMYVGESESRVRNVFSRARSSAPCVIFFDELDALCPKRGGSEGGSNVTERVVNQLLTELDGLESRKDVYIIAATNRLELIDDAMLRPGRLGKLLYIPLPNETDRLSILQALTMGSKKKLSISFDAGAGGVNLVDIANDERTNGFSGADLGALVREAGLAVVKSWDDASSMKLADSTTAAANEDNKTIMARHFEVAFTKVKSSVTLTDRLRYEKVHKYIKQGMGAVQALQLSKVNE